MIRIILTAIISLLSVQLGFSQAIDKEKLDSYLETLEANDKFMGSVAAARDGKVIYAKATGYADIESKTKATTETKYRVGSISKTFTATLILKAVEEKRLSLNQTIEKYFPGIKHANKITVSNLLNHRSGIHNFTNDEAYLEYYTVPKTEAEMVAIIASGGSDFKPDSKAEYSNSNYVLLSYILQDAYGKPFEEIFEKEIVQPLNLKNTRFAGRIDISNNDCNSYNYDGKWVKDAETDMSVPMGAGSVISTPSDLCLFATALFTGKIISEESLKIMMTLEDNYGMGLFSMPFGDKTSYGHTGAIDGFSSVFGYFPDEKVVFANISNANNYNQNNVTLALLSATFNEPYDIPTFETIELSSEDLDQYLGTYSSSSFPMDVVITKSGNRLVAQASGQSSFELNATAKDVFSFDKAGIVLEFNPAEQTMTLKQGGGSYVLKSK